MNRILASIALALVCSGAVAQGSAWRWVDDRGVTHYSDKAPPPGARDVQEVRASALRPTQVPGYTMTKVAADFPVVLYTAESCVDLCPKARNLLTGRGVPFTERVLRSEEDLEAYRKVFGKPDEVPAATVGRVPLRGFEANAWNRALDEVGYPRTAATR